MQLKILSKNIIHFFIQNRKENRSKIESILFFEIFRSRISRIYSRSGIGRCRLRVAGSGKLRVVRFGNFVGIVVGRCGKVSGKFRESCGKVVGISRKFPQVGSTFFLWNVTYTFFVFSFTLELVARNSCTVSTRLRIDNDTKFTVKLKRDDTKWEVIADDKIQMKSCDDSEVTFFILSGLELKTGYNYQFFFEMGDSCNTHETNQFFLQGK